MRIRRTSIIALALTASLVLGACGGDDDDASSTDAPAGSSPATASADTAAPSSDASSTDAPSTDLPDGTEASGTTDGAAAAENSGPVELSLVGFAVPKAANNTIQALFAETPEGEGTTWIESYGPSGDQSRAVVAGLDTDYVHFSLEGDITRLVNEGLVAEDWNVGPNKGIVSTSVVVLVVRPGNPKNITGWADLAKEGIGIVTPNPGSSGSARWNILAAWGSIIANGGTEEDAKAYLTSFFNNTVALPGGGRDATTAFLAGTGDVLISYENEAILARQEGAELDYVVPDETLLIENPTAVLIDADPRAQAFLDFALSDAGQTEFVKKGFRSLNNSVTGVEVEGATDPADPFPTPATLLTITDDFGGWPAAADKFFNEDTGIVTVIQQETGKTS